MNDPYYTLYLQNIFTLAKTIVIKSQASINGINEYLRLVHGTAAVNPDDPTTWKYYLNISGEYHPTDIPMVVRSLDTLGDIPFDREALSYHTATREAYQYGTRYYYRLLSEYPDQEQLILGILYPADMTRAIAAAPGSILAYPPDLIEPQEITLVRDLEDWIKRYNVRWDVPAFGTSDDLYPLAQHAVMYLNLVMRIINLRFRRCRTNEAHSFHIRQYLASHGRLDRYIDYMTLKQRLFLYRNLAYIEHHAGLVDTFQWLLDRLLTERQIPLAEFVIRHLSSFDLESYVEYWVRKRPLNTEYNDPGINTFSLEQIARKELPTARGNAEYYLEHMADIDTRIRNSTSSVIQTKDLESSMYDYNDLLPYPLKEVALAEWAHCTHLGIYKVLVTFKDPATSELKSLYSDDAFKYMVYLTARASNIPLTHLPPYLINRVKLSPKPTLADLNRIIDRRWLPDDVLQNWLLSNHPVKTREFVSRSSFSNYVIRQYRLRIEEWYWTSRTEHMTRRGYVKNVIHRTYEDRVIQFDDAAIPINDWLVARNLPTAEYSVTDALALINSIYLNATGLSIDPTTLISNIQRALIGAMLQLSSYTIQILSEVNTSPIKIIEFSDIRLGDLKASASYSRFIPIDFYIIDQQSIVRTTLPLHDYIDTTYHPIPSPGLTQRAMDIPATHIGVFDNVYHRRLSLDPFVITASYPEYDDAVYLKSAFIGYEYYLALTDAQKASLKSIY